MKYSLRSLKPKRRWYRFGLRTLLAAITLLAIAFAPIGRMFYLQRMAAFHREQELFLFYRQQEIVETALQAPANSSGGKIFTPEQDKDYEQLHLAIRRHRGLFNRYRNAFWRPWTTVDESVPQIVP